MASRIDQAYQHCLAVTRAHYENFPVASWLLPKSIRPAVASIYAFARRADDIADEGEMDPVERLQKLDEWGERLETCDSEPADHDVFIALGETIRRYDLPLQLFRDLLHAFRRDVEVKRYETWDDLLNEYCRFSANPVGRLVLLLFGYRDKEPHLLSDRTCTALQLANFWQDISVDLRKGRIYVPLELMKVHGYAEAAFLRRIYDQRFRSLLSDLIGRTRALFVEGADLPTMVGGRLGWELRGVWVGGTRILEKIEAYPNVFDRRPTLGKPDLPVLTWRTLRYGSRVRHEARKYAKGEL